MRRLAAPSRSFFAAWYSSDSYQRFAASRLSNSSTTSRDGVQSPSSTASSPPRTTKRPPPPATAAGEAALYCSYWSGSWMSVSTMTYAGMRALYAGGVQTSSPEETEAVAAELAGRLRLGDVVTVSGELGTGKTTFVRGACSALGVRERVTSPTFTIGHRYHGSGGEVSHLDLYRFCGVSAALWGDLEPYFEDAIAFVE